MTLALAATLALTACGGDGGPGPTAGTGSSTTGDSTGDSSTASDTPSAPSSTSSTSTPSPTPTDTGAPFDAKKFTGKLTKAVDKNPTVAIDVTAKIGGQQDVTATGVQDLERDALDMDLDLGGQELGYRLVDGQYYLAQPPKWVKVTRNSSNPLIQSTLEQIQLLSMRRQLDAFVAGVEKAGDKGSERIDGVTTTHYTATVDTDKALKVLDIEKGDGVPDSVIYDVWLDEDDLIRQMTFTQNGAKATMTASKWGEPVTIDKPKGSELAKVQ